jgi:hypothetical protein
MHALLASRSIIDRRRESRATKPGAARVLLRRQHTVAQKQ